MRYGSRLWRSLSPYKPAFVDDIYTHSEDSRILYLNPTAPDWITINEKYKPIFDLFNGKNCIKVIFSYINTNFSDEKDILIPQVKELFENSSLFKGNSNKPKNKQYKLPNSIYLTLTDYCNINCIYCYATERNKNENISLEKWKYYVASIIDFAKEPIFTFTGGEPLLLPYVFELANFIREKNCKIILLTNGTLITSNEIARKIAKLFDLVKISLDSLDENICKIFRGDGVLESVKNAFQLLRSNDCNVNILATVTSMTCEQLDEFSKYFENNVNFQPLYVIGRARHNNSLYITGEQYYNALTKNGKFNLLHEYHNKIFNFRNNPCKRCALADAELSIDPNGNVFPCHMLHYDDFICGNLNHQNIKDIYRKSKKMIELRKINVDNIPKCKNCIFRNFCGAACRARIDITKFGITGNDDFCSFEQKQILDALMFSYG